MKLLYFRYVIFLVVCFPLSYAGAQAIKLGDGAYLAAPNGTDRAVPPAPFRTAELLGTAAQTNQWYSSLIFNAKPEVIFVQPLTVQATPAGFEMALPTKEVIPTERRDVEIHYPHRDALVLSPTDFEPR
jgi:hypothetical protein